MTKSRLSLWCDSLIELGCIASLILAPLFFNVHSDRVFEPDKLTLIRSIAVFVLGVWLIRAVDQQIWTRANRLDPRNEASIWRIPFVKPVVGLVLIYIISTLFSVTPSVSWAGSYQRLQGTYTTLSYIVIFALTASTLTTREQVNRFITTAILVSIPVALYGMLQRRELDPLPWGGDTATRIAGHMGNAIFIAAYLIMVVPLTVGRIITSFANILTDEELDTADIIRSSIYIFTLVIQLVAIWWSGSRGPQLGLAAGMFSFVLIFLVTLRNAAQHRTTLRTKDILFASFPILIILAGFGGAVAMSGGQSGVFTFGLFAGSIALSIFAIIVLLGLQVGWHWLWLSWIEIAVIGAIWLVAFNFVGGGPSTVETEAAITTGPVEVLFDEWRNLPGVGRLGRMLEADDGTGRVRVLIWQGALNLFTSFEPVQYPTGGQDNFYWLRPIIGYGPESMYVAYNRYYPPELGTLEARNASPDRSHNETWDALVITGLAGFAIWQWLYISIFINGFKWLGVIRNRTDQILLMGLYFGLGILVGIAFSVWRGPEYFGIAYPIGTMVGVVGYLIYYAFATRPSDVSESGEDPFGVTRLTIIALIGCTIAHYMEIHTGIAIASSRVHFFVYAALLLVVGYFIPQLEAADESATQEESQTKKGGKKRRASRSSGQSIGPVLPNWAVTAAWGALVLTLILITMSYDFVLFTPRPDLVLETQDDLPTPATIIYDSLFVNPRNNFAESPFIYLVIAMSWLLGGFVILSEMAKDQVLNLASTGRGSTKDEGNIRTAGYLLGGLLLVCIGLAIWGFASTNNPLFTPLQRIGTMTIAPLGAIGAGVAAYTCLTGRPNAKMIGVGSGLTAILIALPIMVVGSTGFYSGLILIGLGGAILYFLRGKENRPLIGSALMIGFGSFLAGLIYTIQHAGRIRQNFITPPNITAETAEVVRRIAEADQSVVMLTRFYVFLFLFIIIAGTVMAFRDKVKSNGSLWGGVTVVPALVVAFIFLNVSNLGIIKADMIYKRGKPFDGEATRIGTAVEQRDFAIQFWDNSIGIYEHAISMTPREDFYYLWLGRAYLEKSNLLDGTERDQTLSIAEDRLLTAQSINPLNTDHTANLARLNTRWSGVVEGSDKEERESLAESNYLSAIALSPQNSTIYNELARMQFAFTDDCEIGLSVYEDSIDADPLNEATRFEMVDMASLCLARAGADVQAGYGDIIIEQLTVASEIATRSRDLLAQRWLRGAASLQGAGLYDQAILAYESAIPYANEQEPLWRIQYFAATAYAELGDTERAIELANESLTGAPADAAPQIENFIATTEDTEG